MFLWGISDDSYPKGLIIVFKLKSMQDYESTEQKGADKVAGTAEGCETEEGTVNEDDEHMMLENVNNNQEKSSDDASENCVQESEEMATGASAQEGKDDGTNGSSGKTVVTREDLKQVFRKFGTVKVFCRFNCFSFPAISKFLLWPSAL